MEERMRLDMKTRTKICEAIYRRYRKACKKGKGKILDEHAQTLGYNRDYLARLLANWGKNRYAHVNGNQSNIPPNRPRNAAKGLPEARKQGGRKNTQKRFAGFSRASGSSLTANAGSCWPRLSGG